MLFEKIRLDRGDTLSRLIDNLTEFAAEYGITGRKCRYVLSGNKLLNEAHFARDPSLSMKTINQFGSLKYIELPFVAERIETRTNARIFGFKERGGALATVKILMRYSGWTLAERKLGKSLFTDVRARRLSAPALTGGRGYLIAPHIFDYDRRHGRWIVEEFIPCVDALRDDLAQFAFIDLAAIYGGGARLRPVARRGHVRGWVKALASFDPDFPLPTPDSLWPVALIHNDLSPNIMKTGDGRLCIVDWELARIGPVAVDLASLYHSNPDLKKVLLGALRKLDPEGHAVPPETQIALCLMRSASRLLRNRSIVIHNFMKSGGVEYAEGEKYFERQLRGVRDYLAALRVS